MSQNYIVTITNGDSSSLYDIYFDNISNSNYCTLTVGGGNSTNITYNNLILGVQVTVPDSANRIIIVTLSECKTVLTLPITPYVPPFVPTNLCLEFVSESPNIFGDIPPWTFEPNGSQNGKTKWSHTGNTTGTIYNMIWNITSQQWEIFINPQTTFFNPSTSEPPLGNWRTTNIRIEDISTSQGTCQISLPKIISVEPRNTNCKGQTPCTGSVIINAAGGTPPYQYAITSTPGNPNTISWSFSNIINGICEGNVSCVVKDSTSVISQATQVNISFNEIPKTYNGTITKLRQITTIDQQSPTRKIEAYSEWIFELDQPLDTGVVLNFQLLIDDQNIVHKPFGIGSYSTNTTVVKNDLTRIPTTTTPTTFLSPDNLCIGGTQETFITGYTYDLTYTNGDVISGTTYSSLEITSFASEFGCSTIYEGTAKAIILPNSTTPITGCQCCTFQVGKSSALIQLTTN